MKVRDSIKEFRLIPIDELEIIQGDLKNLEKDEYEKLKQSILEFGFTSPFHLWDDDGQLKLLDGTQRLRTLKTLRDVEKVELPQSLPAVIIDAPDEQTARKILLTLTSQYGRMTDDGLSSFMIESGLDLEFLKKYTRFPEVTYDDILDSLLPEGEGLCDEDEVPEVVEPKSKLGDLYQLGKHKLMCGDSTSLADVQRLMNGELADMWIADPPFGVSYMEKNAAVNGGIVHNQEGKEIMSDTKSVEELCPFWKDAAIAAYEVTTDQAANYWCACQGSDKMMMMMMMMMDEAGWNIRHELIWVKSSLVFGRSDYHYRHEPIIYGWKKKGTHKWYGDRKQDSVLEIDRPNKSDLHPTTKPVELFENFIRNSTIQEQLIFESFGGSGTTLIASEKLNRRSNTMELDPHYCDVIISRWEKYTGRQAELIISI